jgi:cytochrome P450
MLNPSSARHRWDPSTLGSVFQSILLRGRLLKYTLLCFFLSHPRPLALIFAFLRHVRPIAILWNYVFVAKARDVREVLYRLEDFTIADVLGRQMPWGPFMLGIDWPEQHARERKLLQSVVSKADVEKIRDEAATRCRVLIAQARKSSSGRGKIDVVAELCEPVVVDTIQSYFGIPVIGTPQEMARILGQVAGFIMVDPPVGSEPRIKSLDSIARLTKQIVERIEDRSRRIPAPPTDLLTRLVAKLGSKGAPELDKNWIRRYVTGLAVFGGGTITRAATHAIDQLIRHPAQLQQARELAARLEQDTTEFELLKSSGTPWDSKAVEQRIEAARLGLRHIIYEALRFRPMLPVLTRYTPRETMIAKGTRHARLVPAGATVLAAPIAAMFDPEEFERPWRFKVRHLKNYMHFGPEHLHGARDDAGAGAASAPQGSTPPKTSREPTQDDDARPTDSPGPRLCFGKYVADVLIVEIIRALLLCDGLKRAAGSSGRVAYDGPVPRSLVLTLEP